LRAERMWMTCCPVTISARRRDMPIPNSVSRALRGWRPTKLSVLIGEYEKLGSGTGVLMS